MPWVNIFENEDCEVVVDLKQTGNQYPPDPGDVFPIDRDFDNNNPQYFGESFVGLYYNEYNIVGPAIGVPQDAWTDPLPWGMYIIPSGGIAGRRFRARVLQQTSGLSNQGEGSGIIQCPGYFVDGCGWMPAYDEAALVPYNESGNPPVDSEWYEFEVVADEPDAGGLDNTGWVGLFNYENQGNTETVRGFYEWQVWVDGPPPPDPEPCEEHGRVTRAYVSGYQRDRIHRSRLVRGERRCLVANFNGAIPRCRTIARVIWRCDQNQAVYMENARIVREGREVAVDITAQIGWGARVKCEAVLDNGEVYTQLFVIRVVSPPYFMGEPTWYAQGPTELVATA